MAEAYDVIIIGGGPGGLAAASELAPTKHVLVIERNLWGGTCPNFGCDPKKMLYSAVEARDYAARMTGSGITGAPHIDWPALMAFKKRYTDSVPGGTERGLQAQGVTTITGAPELVSPHTVRVAGQRYRGEAIIIATGRTPAMPQVPGAYLLGTSTDFLAMPQLPHTMAFLGAGFVSLELANIAAAAGAQVHIINHSERALRAFPEPAVAQLRALLIKRGVQFHDNVNVTAIAAAETGVRLSGGDFSLTVARAFSAIGRVPALPNGLKALGVAATVRGLTVNDHLQTSVPSIYAVGDVIDKPQPKLTPVAGFEGRYVARQLLGETSPIAYPAQPEIVFSTTKLAQVGVPVATAQAQPDRYAIVTNDVTHWYTYNRVQETDASVTMIEDKRSGQLAGAVVVSTTADELINTVTLLMNAGVSVAQAKEGIYAYPSVTSDLHYLI
ncbi:dihydrolipoyl dehydrogenase family protein [Lacticaseibacillus nasuensis]|uniref:Glutathione reductase n=2 Tax=Lacticaseibacillus TaxID=2759736 RepID=A0A0R1JGN9_9LACO|nr:NAD(P)/FAD-dependent oxidoreductase [Lacticaseibacillus nasuensis]KRK70469.1 glutathione reductase [Lacticaseibacillus nasuensis JCM 17158]